MSKQNMHGLTHPLGDRRPTHPKGETPLPHPLIKPAHKGLLHKDTGTPMGQPIPQGKIQQAAQSPDPAVRKRAIFAENFKPKC